MNDYVTAFEIAGGNTALPWLSRQAYVTTGTVFLGLGVATAIVLLCFRRFRRLPQMLVLLAPGFLILWGLGWLSFAPALFSSYQRADDFYQAYQQQEYEIVEGPVEVLRTQPGGGHAPGDLVRIDGKEFEINFFVMTPAYRQTISHGGALRTGAQVRVFHRNGKILRVDVREDTGQQDKSTVPAKAAQSASSDVR